MPTTSTPAPSWSKTACLAAARMGSRKSASSSRRARDAILANDWNVLGLRATGSVDYTITDLFVPNEFSHPPGVLQPKRGGNVYLIGLLGVAVIGHTGFALGVGRRALDEIAAFARRAIRPDRPPARQRQLPRALRSGRGAVSRRACAGIRDLGGYRDIDRTRRGHVHAADHARPVVDEPCHFDSGGYLQFRLSRRRRRRLAGRSDPSAVFATSTLARSICTLIR